MTKQRKDVLWNAAGSMMYALASMILAFIVIRLTGADEGGIFGFGFSTLGQQIFIIAYFGIRPFHITDVKKEYSFGDYLRVRQQTTGLAVISACAFLAFMYFNHTYTWHKAMLLFLLCIYKTVDAYADVYESELQRQGLLYRTGQSLFYRTLCSVLVLIITLVFTGNLTKAIALSVLIQLLGLYLFSVRVLKQKASPDYTVHDGKGMRLIRNTLLLFVSVFMDFYVFSASKYAVDAVLSNSDSAYFNILFMPTSFIYLLANFMIRPMLTNLAEAYNDSKSSESFINICKRMLQYVFMLCLIVMVLALLLGKPALFIFELLTGASVIVAPVIPGGAVAGAAASSVAGSTAVAGAAVSSTVGSAIGTGISVSGAAAGVLTSEYWSFMLLILGGAFYALANVSYYILVTIRKEKWIFAGYLIASIAAVSISTRFTTMMGLRGAAICYAILMALLFVIFSVAVICSLRTSGNGGSDER